MLLRNQTPKGGTELQFYTAETTGPGTQQRMCIQKDGRVGIGTSSPGAKLEVNGQVSAKIAEFENTTTGTGQDGIFVILKKILGLFLLSPQ